jgi:hypothetical protein
MISSSSEIDVRVKCIYRNGDAHPQELGVLGYAEGTRIDVQYGREYVVFGIMLWQGLIHYLVLNDQTRRPDWEPACLFEVVNGRLPGTWFYRYAWQHPNVPIKAVLGYQELVESGGQHYVDLIEREPQALRIFEERRAEMEEEDRTQLG